MGFITRPACWLSDSYLLLLRTVGRGVVARDWFVAESSKKKKKRKFSEVPYGVLVLLRTTSSSSSA